MTILGFIKFFGIDIILLDLIIIRFIVFLTRICGNSVKIKLFLIEIWFKTLETITLSFLKKDRGHLLSLLKKFLGSFIF
jgi:hypothetical protein